MGGLRQTHWGLGRPAMCYRSGFCSTYGALSTSSSLLSVPYYREYIARRGGCQGALGRNSTTADWRLPTADQ
jgi:hypothetical protein